MLRSLLHAKQNAAEVRALKNQVAALQGEVAALQDELQQKEANLKAELAIPNYDISDLRRRYAEVIKRNDRQAVLLADLAARLDVAVFALTVTPTSSATTGKDER